MTHQADKINVLTAISDRLAATKTHTRKDGEWSTVEYSRIKHWSVLEHEVADFDAMSGLLDKLAGERSSIIVRDRLAEGLSPLKVTRTKYREDTGKGSFVPQEVGLRVLGIDIDDVAVSELMPGELFDHLSREGLEYLLRLLIAARLPKAFANASCRYQWSASAGVKPWDKIRVHLWFFLDRPVFRDSIGRWAKGVSGVDSSFFHSVRVHYTADPVFIGESGEELADIMGSDGQGPLRRGIIRGETDAARAPADWLSRPEHEALLRRERARRTREAAAAAEAAASDAATADELEGRIKAGAEAIYNELPGDDRHGFVLSRVRGLFGYRGAVPASRIASLITGDVERALIAAGRSKSKAEAEAARMIDPLITDDIAAPAFDITPRARLTFKAPASRGSSYAPPIDHERYDDLDSDGELMSVDSDSDGELMSVNNDGAAEVMSAEQRDPRLITAEVGSLLDVTNNGKPKATLSNVFTILTMDERWRGVIAFDDFTLTVITTRLPPWGDAEASRRRYEPGQQWSDGDDNRLRLWLQRVYGFEPSQSRAREAVDTVADRNAVHPVREWLHGLDAPRGDWQEPDSLINTWLIRLAGAKDTPYTRAVGRWWLTAAVARVHPPLKTGAEGVKVDNILILEGEQGQRKSTLFKCLMPFERWFSDSNLPIGDKDALQSLRGTWVYELAELDGYTSKRDAAQLKAFITSAIDDYRPSYGARNVRIPRQCIFAGTANKDEYFRDLTGNRRFWPVRVGEGSRAIKIALAESLREELWSQALAAYRCDERVIVDGIETRKGRWWTVGDKERAMLEAEQSKRLVADSWETSVVRWVTNELRAGGQWPTAEDILTKACRVEVGQFNNHQRDRVRAVMKALGFETKRVRRDGARVRVYHASDDVVKDLLRGGVAMTVDNAFG